MQTNPTEIFRHGHRSIQLETRSSGYCLKGLKGEMGEIIEEERRWESVNRATLPLHRIKHINTTSEELREMNHDEARTDGLTSSQRKHRIETRIRTGSVTKSCFCSAVTHMESACRCKWGGRAHRDKIRMNLNCIWKKRGIRERG